ncbi:MULTISPECIES: septal ring lytic transglycosylase RlpA family protein [Pseudomonas]|uniref:Endolytic peptidoglycan transglycosylase RlpA n=1 Tax=Pseudomonas lutea TaxID=243924 RepID=A0A9X8QIY9_9PSED|nr:MULTISPECIES: septal ring lytic transglycosylase RlpA family protein [Pseudomonas]MCG7373467.1 septal ring lytic transglycosylase RlpA family protein [Pseudomonas luteola]SEQ25016.1 rare lipoprotein A [Pseudomonas lutea]
MLIDSKRLLLFFCLLVGCVACQDKKAEAVPIKEAKQAPKPFEQKGKASYYSQKFHGRETASGETFNNNTLVAAHKTLPLGSKVRVTNLENNKQVVVRITDRGPFIRGRIIDLSRAAAKRVDLVENGTGPVKIERID